MTVLADVGIGVSPSFGQGVVLIVMSAIITLAVDVLRRWIYRKIDRTEGPDDDE